MTKAQRERLSDLMLCAADAALVLRPGWAAAYGGGRGSAINEALGLTAQQVKLFREATEVVIAERIAADPWFDLDYPYGGPCIDGAVEVAIETAYRIREGSL